MSIQGALSKADLIRAYADGVIQSETEIAGAQFQPASLDLTLSTEAYKVSGSILPLKDESVRDLISMCDGRRVDLSQPFFLDRGQVLLVRMREKLALPPTMGAYTNNKSSIGRIDLQTRTLSDGNPRYEKHARGYHGDLWIEIIPKSFEICLKAGVSLNQLILYGDRQILSDDELRAVMKEQALLFDGTGCGLKKDETLLDHGVLMSVDLDQELVGYVAKRSARTLFLDRPHKHLASEFFEPIKRPENGRLLLAKGHFYILCTRERICVPPDLAAEMLPYETTAGEFRAHYAGFFDPGFGWGQGGAQNGTIAVLELRPYDDDIFLRHGQPICKMAYERLTKPCEELYGEGGGQNHYATQTGPRLSKYFL